MFRKYLYSLQTLVGVTVAVAVLFASTLAYFDQRDKLQKEHSAEIREELSRLARLTALAMRESMWQFVPEQAESIIDSIFVNPEIVRVEVLDHRGNNFAGRTQSGLAILRARGETETTAAPIERDGAVIGTLQIEMSTSGYLDKQEEALRRFVRAGGIVLATSLIIIFFVLRWGLVRPTRRLVNESSRIAQGDLQSPIAPVFSTELGALASSLEATRLSLVQLIRRLEENNHALHEANITLEQRVKERTASLETALQKLQLTQAEMVQAEKLASLGRVVAGVAHELNTPIGNALTVASTIGHHLEQMQTDLESGTLRKSTLLRVTADSRQAVDIFVRNIERAAHLISNFKQVAVDQASDQRRVFDLSTVTDEVLSTLVPALRKAGCTLQTTLAPDVSCDGYPGSYGQVLTNLVMNAVVHGYRNEPGDIEVSTGIDPQTGHAVLSVTDRGVGMDDSVVRRIFDPFFTTRLGSGGTGLGMNIVHALVHRTLMGQISIQSSPGAGTTIQITFPRTVPAVPPAED